MERNITNATIHEHGFIPLAIPIAFLIIGIAAIFLNTCVMIAYIVDRSIRDVPVNMFILILSIADFLTGMDGVLLFWLLTYDVDIHPGTQLTCRVISLGYYFPITLSILSVILISGDRFYMVRYPFRYRRRTKQQSVIIILIMLLIMAMYLFFTIWALPLLYKRLYGTFGDDGGLCHIINSPRKFVILSIWFDLVVPIVVLVVLNIGVVSTLYKTTQERFLHQMTSKPVSPGNPASVNEGGSGDFEPVSSLKSHDRTSGGELGLHSNPTFTNQSHDQLDAGHPGVQERGESDHCPTDRYDDSKNKHKNRNSEEEKAAFSRIHRTAKRLRIFVIVFVVGWLPLHVTLLVGIFVPVADWVKLLAFINLTLNSAVNPFLYAMMSNKFRQRFILMSKCRKR